MSKITFEIDVDQAAEIVRNELIESYDDLHFVMESEKEERKMRKALSRVIMFYSTPQQQKEWKERIKND